MPLPLKIALNLIASEAFRDQADRDYVHARAAWRLQLRDQLQWSLLQALEKYLKGILLFDGRSARYVRGADRGGKEFGHSLTLLSTAVDALPGYTITHPAWWQDYIERLEHAGQNRYLTRNAATRFDSLERMDAAVWSVRRYCQHMRFDHKLADGSVRAMLSAYMNTANHASYRLRPHRLRLIGGQLERWMQAPTSEPARQMLVWNNRYFGSRHRKKLSYRTWSSFVDAPVNRDWAKDAVLREELKKYLRFE